MSKSVLIPYLAALLAIVTLDALWLGWLARGLYQRELGLLMRDSVMVLPAALFYLGYPMLLVLLALGPHTDALASALPSALWRAGLVGLVAYGTYDLTNLATLRGWSTVLTLYDIAWGVVISLGGACAAWLARERWG